MPSYGLSVIYGGLIHGELIFGWPCNSRRRAFARNVEILLIFFSELHPYHGICDFTDYIGCYLKS